MSISCEIAVTALNSNQTLRKKETEKLVSRIRGARVYYNKEGIVEG
jgi:hypothetical protein